MAATDLVDFDISGFRVLVWNVENLTAGPRPGRCGYKSRVGYIASVIDSWEIDLCLLMETGPDVDTVAGEILKCLNPLAEQREWHYDKKCSDETGKPTDQDYEAETYCAIFKDRDNSDTMQHQYVCTVDLVPNSLIEIAKKNIVQVVQSFIGIFIFACFMHHRQEVLPSTLKIIKLMCFTKLQTLWQRKQIIIRLFSLFVILTLRANSGWERKKEYFGPHINLKVLEKVIRLRL